MADGFNLEEFVGSPRGILYVVLLAVSITILTSPSLYTFLLGKFLKVFTWLCLQPYLWFEQVGLERRTMVRTR